MTQPKDSIDFKATAHKGRYLISNHQLNPGDIFFPDDPLISVCVSTEHCSNCLVKLNDPNFSSHKFNNSKNGKGKATGSVNGLSRPGLASKNKIYRCQACQREFYCCRSCQISAWRKYHWMECQMYNVFKDRVNDRLALRLLLLAAYNGVPLYGIAKENQSEIAQECDPEIIKLLFKHEKYYKLHLTSFLDNVALYQSKTSLNARRLAAIVAQAITVYCHHKGEPGDMIDLRLKREHLLFENSGIIDISYFNSYKKIAFNSMKETTTKFDPTSVLQHQLAGIFLRLINLVKKNAVTMSNICSFTPETSNSEMEIDERKQIALIIYPKVSFLNHSCKPNAFLAFGTGGAVQVKLTQGVAMGEEVNISYGPIASRHRTHDRQKFLSENYGFKCRCIICADKKTTNDIDLTLELSTKYRCPNCQGPIQKIDGSCSACDEDLEDKIVEILQLADAAKEKFARSIRAPSKAFELLKSAYSDASASFFEMNENIKIIRDNLALEHCKQKNYSTAAELVFQNYKLICMRFGTDSIEAANELLKLSGLWCKQKEKEKRGLIAYRHATNVLNIYKFDEISDGNNREKSRSRQNSFCESFEANLSNRCLKVGDLFRKESVVYYPPAGRGKENKDIITMENIWQIRSSLNY